MTTHSKTPLKPGSLAKTAKVAEEMVDVVDEKDKVTETLPRSVVQAKRLRHRVVHIMVENAAGDLLVQWRVQTKAYAPHTFTASVAGTVSAGDDYDTTAAREAVEELGLSGLAMQRIGKVVTKTDFPSNVAVYVAQHDGEVSGWEEEAEVIDFWSLEEAEYMLKRYPYLLAHNFVASLKTYLTWRKKHDR